MMCSEDNMEKKVPSIEEEDKEKEEIEDGREEAEEEGEADEGDEQDGDDDDEEEGRDDEGGEQDGDVNLEEEGRDDEGKEEEEAAPQATDKKIPLPVKAKEKKQDDVLNLNNEVVKMRKEVKRVRALIIRKLTRQSAALKKKKGKETEIERNQRRAARLLEEIHAMKKLVPDLVTKTALQKNLNFEEVCKDPKSSISDRAIARIATHPQFNKKIENIKAAVKAFKEERMKGRKQGRKEKVQNEAGKATVQSADKRGGGESEKNKDDNAVELKEVIDGEERVDVIKDTEDAAVAKVEQEVGKEAHSADTADAQMQEMPESQSVRPASVKSSNVKDIVKKKPQRKAAEKKPNPQPAPAVIQKRTDDEESDLESDDEEKEYFDDSTEERFHKQSSQSEDSDDDDDFFMGKVSKFKKKKKQKDGEGEEKAGKKHDVKKESTDNMNASDKLQSELDELESRLKSKATSLQSVFCSSLAKAGRGGGTGRGRGGDRFRGQGNPKGNSGLNRDFSKQSKFQRQEKGTERSSGSKYSKPCPEGRRHESEEKGFASAGRGRGRGRGDAHRQRDQRGRDAFSHQAPQQALHPSWEASKKRKEQQGQILAFQGKKIKFDDDD